jgi:hypothetical protein
MVVTGMDVVVMGMAMDTYIVTWMAMRMVAMDIFVVAMYVVDLIMAVMDTVVTTVMSVIVVTLAGRNDGVAMSAAVMVIDVVAMGIVMVTRFNRVQVGWWPPGHIGAPGAGGRETGSAHCVLICGVRHVSGHAPIWEIRQVRNLVSSWHLV